MEKGIGPTIVSVCVEGGRCRRPSQNAYRAELLHQIIAHLAALNWGHIDAVLLPGGYFCIPALPRQQNYKIRCQAIYQDRVADECQQAAAALNSFVLGCQLVLGIDTLQRWADENGDQFCFALSQAGITGLARKIFPTDADTSFDELPPMLVYAEDYSCPRRFITLGEGKAALAACYDAFGFAGAALGDYGIRRTAIRYIWSGQQDKQFTDRDFDQLRSQCLENWQASLKLHNPNAALIAIHGFKQLAWSSRWQRHGLATASAGIGGGLAVGAAHLKSGWASLKIDPAATALHSTLAAGHVPKSHLHDGIYRQCHFLPAQAVSLLSKANLPKVLFRLFTL